MGNYELDVLLKGECRSLPKRNKPLNYGRRKINGICKSLSIDSKTYDPSKTLKSVEDYLSEKNETERILYSEISNYIFSLDLKKRGTFATNIDNLLQYSLDENCKKSDCQKIIIKIYDHFQLSLYQIENAKNIQASGLEEVKEGIRNDNKKLEREYVTILGIFAAIVSTFVGGITFSSAALSSINNTSIYRLLFVVNGMGFILLNAMYMLMYFIFVINDKPPLNFKIFRLNLTFGIIALIILLAWLLKLHTMPDYIVSWLLPYLQKIIN